MNGQKIFQRSIAGGDEWETTKVEPGTTVRPGIYYLDTALPADRAAAHEGQIVHSDEKSVFQQCGTRLVKHKRSAFKNLPAAGSVLRVKYEGDQVKLSAPTRSRRL
jgi:KfrB protein